MKMYSCMCFFESLTICMQIKCCSTLFDKSKQVCHFSTSVNKGVVWSKAYLSCKASLSFCLGKNKFN